MTRHLRLQLTLLATEAGGWNGAIAAGEFRTVLATSGRHFPVILHLGRPAVPGGSAVHCEATLLDPTLARSFFPAGAQFEQWEGSRRGYGYVLNVNA